MFTLKRGDTCRWMEQRSDRRLVSSGRRASAASTFPTRGAIADNAQQKFFVIGPAVPLTADLDLPGIGVRVSINGAPVGTGRGDAVLGHPLRSVAWLAGKLAAYGRGLRAGDHIMTGSFTRQFPIARGDRIRAEFERVGAVEAVFA